MSQLETHLQSLTESLRRELGDSFSQERQLLLASYDGLKAAVEALTSYSTQALELQLSSYVTKYVESEQITPSQELVSVINEYLFMYQNLLEIADNIYTAIGDNRLLHLLRMEYLNDLIKRIDLIKNVSGDLLFSCLAESLKISDSELKGKADGYVAVCQVLNPDHRGANRVAFFTQPEPTAPVNPDTAPPSYDDSWRSDGLPPSPPPYYTQ